MAAAAPTNGTPARGEKHPAEDDHGSDYAKRATPSGRSSKESPGGVKEALRPVLVVLDSFADVVRRYGDANACVGAVHLAPNTGHLCLCNQSKDVGGGGRKDPCEGSVSLRAALVVAIDTVKQSYGDYAPDLSNLDHFTHDDDDDDV